MVDVQEVPLSAVSAGGGMLTERQREQILTLFQRHGATFAPAVLINDQVRFAGKQLTIEQLKEALQSVMPPQS